MSETTLKFETPLPGEEVSRQDGAVLVQKFKIRFRNCDASEIPGNVPTACVLKGRKDPGYLDNPKFQNRSPILFYIESAELLYRTTPSEAVNYLSSREPWEDYDICLFDESLRWCVGVTHNDDIIVVD